MAPITKKRKVTTFDTAPRVSVVLPTRNTAIASFTRVTKAAVASHTHKEATILQEISNESTGRKAGKGTKRKPEDSNDFKTPLAKAVKTVNGGRVKAATVHQLTQDENIAPAIAEIRSATPPPSLPKRQNGQLVGSVEPDTPTKGTRHSLAAFTLSSSPAKNQLKVSSLFPTSSSPAVPTPCPKKRRRDDDLPDELQELIDLHTSLLSVLSVHYAHNGTATPVDLKSITPGMGKAWGRRNPTTEDIRRVLAIQQRSAEGLEQAALLSVWDYGRGETCIEYCRSAEGKAWGRHRQPLETQKLSEAFSTFIREQHIKGQQENLTAAELVDMFPLARLHKRAASKAQKSAMLSKGQARLTELKQGAIEAQKRVQPKLVAKVETAQKASQAASKSKSSGQSLLDRIRAKESFLAAQPAGPSQAQLERSSALQRAPDVINVLSLLSGNSASSSSPNRGLAPSPMSASSGRTSDDELAAMLGMSTFKATPAPGNRGIQAMFGGVFPTKNVSMSLQQVVERVQSSMRSSIAASEVERVIRLLASDICPEWIQLRELGSVRGVTIRGSGPMNGWKEKCQTLMSSC